MNSPSSHLKGSDFVNVVIQDGMVLAACYGEVFCLDTLTGDALWHNPLKGFGTGLATIAIDDSPQGGATALLAEKRRRDEEASAASTSATCV